MTKIISGTDLAKKLRAEIKEEATILQQRGITPTLAVVLVGDNKASKSYVNSKHKACLENNINSVKIELDENISTASLLNEIEKLNNDDNVHGILVQLPLPKHIDAEQILNAVSPQKDVDGFHPINVGKLVIGEAKLIPCTPLGILEMIKSTGDEIDGKLALVIGRSNIVGKPISTLLLQNNATVITAHSKTKNLDSLLEQADIIVSCVGSAHFLTGEEKVKETVTIIDVGNNYKDGKLVGDVNLENFIGKVKYISPVPGGVGPLTITMLMRNTLVATYDLIK
ncbi:MAG: bifunctional methylenetetrahydrofolate dehydrogenase/methenyltetrahydrofolate cyclohydrolase [Gemella morbillorum]|uniref:Bifunctional protein FolD n=2 Tax=Gemella morbillorum TaxID=29391 RepID=A0AAP9KTC7_9BACL|nr:bifunctional methylenetetrahydrofolate dehydrogenase/methenyltetrahydrofolate cyclohydrolase [Gemella morbillorum]EFV36052.1 tetrahydrofolate dehydrogenase/cyclohydrolase [Gemella morbillorum M424]MDK8240058.1 bifunctional methylenetetrahydrofolate dehydrogenase/methenyltetrahydrofolate cyclohydrolase [Gemella morbillorum]QGS09359.1 bifunctional methylenetetrahydrofolate dehydrogenase/methenyltetrahydrofolate cyclohydrolase [Gemella morbillorum]